MSLNEILGSALSGLSASQAGLRTVSNNIANVGTPGYAREKVVQSTAIAGGRITGVAVSDPSRVADRFLEATVYKRGGDVGEADVTSSYLDRLQSLLGSTDAESSLSARLDAISSSATAMAAAPNSPQTVAAFTSSVQDTISSMQQLNGDVDGLRGDVESEVGSTVSTINGLLSRINDLNDTVSRLTTSGRSTAGPADQRMSAIEQLSSLMQINVRDQPDGRVTIETGTGTLLLDRRLRQLSYPDTGGVSQPTYPSIDIRFAEAGGGSGAATGEKIDSVAVGGKLGGLLDLRDRALPQFSEKLGVFFGGLAETVNAVSNAGTTVPPPTSLTGQQTALVGGDRLGFTGAATFAVTKADGTLVAKTSIDFTAPGANATVDDAVAAINAGLGTAGSASFVDGKLKFSAGAAGNGVVIAQDDVTPSSRAGIGFSQFFGLNDIVHSDDSTLVPSGFTASDPHGFASGETAQVMLRDSTGRALTSYTLTGAVGNTFGDLVTELNQSPIAAFGTFAMDDRGRIQFQPDASVPGAMISIPSDSTDRLGTGRSFSSISGLTGLSSGLSSAQVRPDIQVNASDLPLAQLQTTAAVGTKALGAGDNRGAAAFVSQLGKTVDLGKDGVMTLDRFSSLLLGNAGVQSAQAQARLTDVTARRDDAVNRRDSYSGVNLDEELAQMVVLQNSYSAAARVISTASQMYDTLIAMMG